MRRATRLAARGVLHGADDPPISMAEIRADRDWLRAECAVSSRRAGNAHRGAHGQDGGAAGGARQEIGHDQPAEDRGSRRATLNGSRRGGGSIRKTSRRTPRSRSRTAGGSGAAGPAHASRKACGPCRAQSRISPARRLFLREGMRPSAPPRASNGDTIPARPSATLERDDFTLVCHPLQVFGGA